MRKSTIPGLMVLGLAVGGVTASSGPGDVFAFDRFGGAGEIQLASDHRPVVIYNNSHRSDAPVLRSDARRFGSDRVRMRSRVRSHERVIAASDVPRKGKYYRNRKGSDHPSHH